MDTGRVCMVQVQEIIDQMSQPVAPPVLDAFISKKKKKKKKSRHLIYFASFILALSFFFFPLCPLLHLVTHSTLTHTLSISTNITINQKKDNNKQAYLPLSFFVHTAFTYTNWHRQSSPPSISFSLSSFFALVLLLLVLLLLSLLFPFALCRIFFSSEEDNHCYLCFCTLLYSSKTTNKNQQQTTTNKKQPHFLFPFFFLSPLLFSFLFSSLLFLVHSSFFLSLLFFVQLFLLQPLFPLPSFLHLPEPLLPPPTFTFLFLFPLSSFLLYITLYCYASLLSLSCLLLPACSFVTPACLQPYL
ncbi:hypothetical protein F5H01DRAFT_1264 [Linnemannia elongata]|nr:hypothetical protein F5H01DRAFT_1264 [Linnemannia elongata]